jgi:hypothetical protein
VIPETIPTIDVSSEPTVYRDTEGEPIETPGVGYYTRTYHVTVTATDRADADQAFEEFEGSFDKCGDIAIGQAQDDVQDEIVIYGSSFEPVEED